MNIAQAVTVAETLEAAGYQVVTYYLRHGRWLVSAWRDGEEYVFSDFRAFV